MRGLARSIPINGQKTLLFVDKYELVPPVSLTLIYEVVSSVDRGFRPAEFLIHFFKKYRDPLSLIHIWSEI